MVVLFDKADINFHHLYVLHRRAVFWVTRAKDNKANTGKRSLLKKSQGDIQCGDLIVLSTAKTRTQLQN